MAEPQDSNTNTNRMQTGRPAVSPEATVSPSGEVEERDSRQPPSATDLIRINVPLRSESYERSIAGSIELGRLSQPFLSDWSSSLGPQPTERVTSTETLREPASSLVQAKSSLVESQWRRWWQEISLCCLGLVCLMALVIVLKVFQGNTLPNWPLHLSINTLVSVLNLVLKVSVTIVVSSGLGQLKWAWFREGRPLDHLRQFDEASKGIRGASELLYSLKGRALLSSAGVLLGVAISISDPFSQALVNFFSCKTPVGSDNASVSITHMPYLATGVPTYAGLKDIGVGGQEAMTLGILNASLVPASFSCPSGNCTFQPYHSSAYCSQCVDVSSQIVSLSKDNTTDGVYWPLNGLELVDGSAWNTSSVGSYSEGTGIVTEYSHALIAIIQILVNYGAFECQIYNCVNTYNGQIASGVFTEAIASSSVIWGHLNDSWGTSSISSEGSTSSNFTYGPAASVDISCLNATERAALTKIGCNIGSVSDGPNWVALNSTTFGSDNYELVLNVPIRAECAYFFHPMDQDSVTEFLLGRFLPGTFKSGPDVVELGSNFVPQLIYKDGAMNLSTLDDTFQGLVQAMTSYARSTAPASHLSFGQVNGTHSMWIANGTSWKQNTCINVHWPWIAFPATMVVGTVLFLAATIFTTDGSSEASKQDYKASILPVIIHGIERRGDQKGYESIRSVKAMTRDAKSIRVRFAQTSDGWRFVEDDG